MKARLKPNLFFLLLAFVVVYYTVQKKINTSTMCSSVDVYLLAYSGAMIGWCLVKQRVFAHVRS